METTKLCCSSQHFYELQTLVREFSPFCKVEEASAENLSGSFAIVIPEDEKSALALDPGGRQLLTARIEDITGGDFDNYIGERSKNEAKVCLYTLLSELGKAGIETEDPDAAEALSRKEALSGLPWGILTGVRPSKVVYAYLEQGLREDEISPILQRFYCLRRDKAILACSVASLERQLMADQKGEDVSVYVGIPFCPTRCAYCSFISSDSRAFKKYADAYLACLFKEIEAGKALLKDRHLRSFYMGGGTPTTLSADQLDGLLTRCEDAFRFESLKEITVEAGRPDTITMEKLLVLKKHGVGRISINPQTMNQETLDRVGRRHTVEEIRQAFHMAREAGFKQINMDLILGLPGEGIPEVRNTLEEIEQLRPDNLTVHTLAIKRSSWLNESKEGSRLLNEDPQGLFLRMDESIRLAGECAARLGMRPYYMYRQKNMAGNFENVGYALPGTEGLYNIEIMEERQSIVSFGAGGVSKIYSPRTNRIERIANVKGPEEYIRRIDEMIRRKQEGVNPSELS